jgi:hypothetical protein
LEAKPNHGGLVGNKLKKAQIDAKSAICDETRRAKRK